MRHRLILPKANSQARPKRGFALVAALSLMSFLMVLFVTLGTVTRIELLSAQTASSLSEARRLAIDALHRGIAQLQRNAGPDARLTARAELLGDDIAPGARFWTGVWDASNPDSGPRWLVSGTSDPSNIPTTSARIADPETDWTTGQPQPAVLVPYENASNGLIAWWTMDEGVKTSLVASVARRSGTEPDITADQPEAETNRRLRLAPEQVGLKALIQSADADSIPLPDFSDPFFQASLQRVGDPIHLQQLVPAASKHFSLHDFTTISLGVLSRTDGEPGLKADLSADPEALDSFMPGSGEALARHSAFNDYMEATSAEGDGLSAMAPEDLRRVHSIVPPTTTEPAEGQAIHSVAPIITDFGIRFGFRTTQSSYPAIQLALKAGLEMWNPYTTALRPTDFAIEVSGLEPLSLFTCHGPSEDGPISNSPIEVNLHDHFGDPIRFRFNFTEGARQLDGTPQTSIEDGSYDRNLWGPGRIHYWRLRGVSSSNISSLPMGEAWLDFGNRTANLSQYVDTGLTYDISVVPVAEAPDNLFLAFEMNAAEIEVRLLKRVEDPTHEEEPVLQRISEFTLSDIPRSARFPLIRRSAVPEQGIEARSGWESNHIGFQLRLRERGNHIDDDPSLWIRQLDPRSPAAAMESSASLMASDTSTAYTGRAEDVFPDDIKAFGDKLPLAQDDAFESVFLFERVLPTSVFTAEQSGTLRDIPLFELPRQPLLSIAQLQHLQFGGFPPYAVGNPWGRNKAGSIDLNGIFDRFFFSGITTAGAAAGAAGSTPANPRIVPIRKTAAQAQAEADNPAPADVSGMLVSGAFNINSTSVTAWHAALTATQLDPFRAVDKEINQHDEQNLDASATIPASSEPAWDFGPFFTRFPQSIEEHFDLDLADYGHPLTSRPNQFFQRGLCLLSQRTGEAMDPENWSSVAGDETEPPAVQLATAIVEELKQRGQPFTSMQEFLSDTDDSGRSLIERAMKRVRGLHDGYLPGLEREPIDERTPAYLSQADILTPIAPFASVRSDTFRIRALGSLTDPATAEILSRAVCEAVVQRLPETLPAEETESGPGTPMRSFKIIDFTWIQ